MLDRRKRLSDEEACRIDKIFKESFYLARTRRAIASYSLEPEEPGKAWDSTGEALDSIGEALDSTGEALDSTG